MYRFFQTLALAVVATSAGAQSTLMIPPQIIQAAKNSPAQAKQTYIGEALKLEPSGTITSKTLEKEQARQLAALRAGFYEEILTSDTDADGRVSLQEVDAANALGRPGRFSRLTPAQAFEVLDTNTDGFVEFAEINAYARTGLNRRLRNSSRESMIELLIAMDRDGDGGTTLNEIVATVDEAAGLSQD